jgi:hypothetical protein
MPNIVWYGYFGIANLVLFYPSLDREAVKEEQGTEFTQAGHFFKKLPFIFLSFRSIRQSAENQFLPF